MAEGSNPLLATHSDEYWTAADQLWCWHNGQQTYEKTYLHAPALDVTPTPTPSRTPTPTPSPTPTQYQTATPGPTSTATSTPMATPTKPSPAITDRASWNCPTDELEAPNTTPVPQEPVMVIVHHTDSRNDPSVETQDSNDKHDWAVWSDFLPGGIPGGTVSEYYDPIQDTWAGEVLMVWLTERYRARWTDTAYHYLIDGDGNIYQGSYYGIDYEKGATCSEISQMIQVALLGCFEPGVCVEEGGAATPSSAAIDALEMLIEWLGCNQKQFLLPDGGTVDNVKGHRDVDDGSVEGCSTLCPGQNLYDLLPDVRSRLSCGTTSFQVKFVNTSPRELELVSTEVPDNYITLMGHKGVNIYVTDPLGRRLGTDPVSGEILNEIPGADFEDNPVWGDDSVRGDVISMPTQLVIAHIPYFTDGIYQVYIHGALESSVGGVGLSAREHGNVKAMRILTVESDQELSTEYKFVYSRNNSDLVTDLFEHDTNAPITTYQTYGKIGNNG